jgi:16S rRNA (adenine1518-N6/adenine1519-N6)-dimethyltransferase
LGQHFLNDRRILARIVDVLDPQPNETVIEIGPGEGSLTALLRPRAAHLVAVELDRDLAAALRDRYDEDAHVQIIEGDALDMTLADLRGDDGWCVTGNVPYYITTPLLFHALAAPRPRCIVFLVQREVGDRLAAAPGSEAYGALSVTAQAVAEVSRHGRVPAGAFQPAPAVDSVIVRLTPLSAPLVSASEEAAFKTLVQGAFSQRRKQMIRVLRGLYELDAERTAQLLTSCGIEPHARPEVLSPNTFVELLRVAQRAGLAASAPNARRSRRSRSSQPTRDSIERS